MSSSFVSTARSLARSLRILDRPPPFEGRNRNGRWQVAARGIHPRAMRVRETVRETADTVTILLDSLDGRELDFRAGQFLTVIVDVDGVVYRRCYSFSSPEGAPPAITSKRIPEGVVSTYLNERLEPGDVIRVLGPSGEFTLEPDSSASRRIVLVAGGSGITPIASLAETLAAMEPETVLELLYGNRAWPDVIFLDRLDRLARRHGNLSVRHVLEDETPGPGGDRAPARSGRLTGDTVLDLVSRPLDVDTFFICGPEPMRESVVDALGGAGVASDRIRVERFVIADKLPFEKPARPGEVVFQASDRTVTTSPGQTILQAGLADGLELDYSCTMGGCGACKLRRLDGRVVMEEPHCLTPPEVEEGWFLACCGYADGTVTVAR